MLYDIKSSRAVWDPSLSVPGTNRRGGWRCPEGARFGGQITDRFGRNCGWSLVRRLGRSTSGLGRTLRQASNDINSSQRRTPISEASRPGKSILNAIGSKLGFRVARGRIDVSEGIEPSKFWSVFGDRPIGDDETKKKVIAMRKTVDKQIKKLQAELAAITDDSDFKNQREVIESKIQKLKSEINAEMVKFATEQDEDKRNKIVDRLRVLNQQLLTQEGGKNYINGVMAANSQFVQTEYSRIQSPPQPETPTAKDLLDVIKKIDPFQSRTGGSGELIDLLKRLKGDSDVDIDVLVETAYREALLDIVDDLQDFMGNKPIDLERARRLVENADDLDESQINRLDILIVQLQGDNPDWPNIKDRLHVLLRKELIRNLDEKRIQRRFPGGLENIWSPPPPDSKPDADFVDRHIAPVEFKQDGRNAPDKAFVEKAGGEGIGPELIMHPDLLDVEINESDLDENSDENYVRLRLERNEALRDFNRHKQIALVPRRHLFYVVSNSDLFREIRPDVQGNVGDTRLFALRSNPNVGFVFKRDQEGGWIDNAKFDEIFGHHFAAALGFPNGGAFMDGVDDYDDMEYEGGDAEDILHQRRYVVIPFAFRNIPQQYEQVQGWDDDEDNFEPGQLDQVEDRALPARLYHLLALFAMSRADRHGGNAFGKAYDVDGKIVPLIMPIDFGGFRAEIDDFFEWVDLAWLERLEDDEPMAANFPGVIADHMKDMSEDQKEKFRKKMVAAFDLAIERMEVFIKNSDEELQKLIRHGAGDMPREMVMTDGEFEFGQHIANVEARLADLKEQRKTILERLLV